MEVIWNQLIIARAVVVVVVVVVVEEVDPISKFACVVFFSYMSAEMDARQIMHEKF